jgi:hypothetical protein
MRGIDSIIDIPTPVFSGPDALRDFAAIAFLALTYAPDRLEDDLFQGANSERLADFADTVALEHELESRFFSELYVDRPERREIARLLPAKRPIRVHGKVGTGKTVVLRKLEYDATRTASSQFVYFDCKARIERFEQLAPDEFESAFRSFVYDELWDRVLAKAPKEVLTNWVTYKIQKDTRYASFRQWVVERLMRPLRDADEWLEAISLPEVRSRLDEFDLSFEGHRPEIKTLLEFLDHQRTLVLCFDNIDRYDLEMQRRILKMAIDFSNEGNIAVITAIREPNLRRLARNGELGDVILSDRFEKLRFVSPKTVPTEDLDEPTVYRILDRRLQLLEQLETSTPFEPLFEELRRDMKYENKSLRAHFWRVFRALGKSYVHEEIYELYNHNLRHLLFSYFELISGILYGNDAKYTLDELVPLSAEVRRTQLRNCFYKWLLCNGQPLPSQDQEVLNIYRCRTPSMAMVDLRILEFLNNWSRQELQSQLQFYQIQQALAPFGLDSGTLVERLGILSQQRDFAELGFVWIDKGKSASIAEKTTIELMPAGAYMVSVLSRARDYVFWCALNADLDVELTKPPIRYAETYSDAFKLEVVLLFVAKILVPGMQDEKAYFDKHLHPPRYGGSNWEYYKAHFAIKGHLYPYRLLESLRKTIDYSDLTEDQKRHYTKRIDDLGHACLLIERGIEL